MNTSLIRNTLLGVFALAISLFSFQWSSQKGLSVEVKSAHAETEITIGDYGDQDHRYRHRYDYDHRGYHRDRYHRERYHNDRYRGGIVIGTTVIRLPRHCVYHERRDYYRCGSTFYRSTR